MANLRKIITDAYRESGIIQKNSVPDAAQVQEGYDKLTMLIQSVFGEEVGGNYIDVNFGQDGLVNIFSSESNEEPFITSSYVRPSYRLMVNKDSPATIYLDPAPYDGARLAVVDVAQKFATAPLTVVADTRRIEGQKQVILNTNGANVSWFYRADLGQWVKLSPLALDDSMPFPFEFDDYFTMKLAMRLHPRYLVQTSQETMMFYKEAERKFRSRYTTSAQMPVETAMLRLSGTPHYNFSIGNTDVRFSKGFAR